MLPKEFGSGSTCHHRRFQQWVQLDIFKKIWIILLKEYDDKKGNQMDVAIHIINFKKMQDRCSKSLIVEKERSKVSFI
jgi:hypothetical protein